MDIVNISNGSILGQCLKDRDKEVEDLKNRILTIERNIRISSDSNEKATLRVAIENIKKSIDMVQHINDDNTLLKRYYLGGNLLERVESFLIYGYGDFRVFRKEDRTFGVHICGSDKYVVHRYVMGAGRSTAFPAHKKDFLSKKEVLKLVEKI